MTQALRLHVSYFWFFWSGTMRFPFISLALLIVIGLIWPKFATSEAVLTCQITSPADAACSPHVLLEKGDLVINDEDFFVFTALYMSCYHREDVTIRGQVQKRSFPGGFSLELLAGEITHKPSEHIEKFPRTIGTVHLDEALLQGRFTDTWAPLRTSGVLQPTSTLRQIRCISAHK